MWRKKLIKILCLLSNVFVPPTHDLLQPKRGVKAKRQFGSGDRPIAPKSTSSGKCGWIGQASRQRWHTWRWQCQTMSSGIYACAGWHVYTSGYRSQAQVIWVTWPKTIKMDCDRARVAFTSDCFGRRTIIDNMTSKVNDFLLWLSNVYQNQFRSIKITMIATTTKDKCILFLLPF